MLIPAVWDLWTLGVVLAFKSSSFGRRRPLLHEKPLLSHLVAGLLKILWKEGISGHGIAEYASGISREGILFQHFIFLFFQETSPIGKIQTDCFSKRKNRVNERRSCFHGHVFFFSTAAKFFPFVFHGQPLSTAVENSGVIPKSVATSSVERRRRQRAKEEMTESTPQS